MSSGRRASSAASKGASHAARRAPHAPAPPVAAAPAGPAEHLVLALLMAAYAGAFGFAVWSKHHWFLYTDFDLAIFTQAIQRLVHGSVWNSVRGMAWPGDHSSLVLVPLAPLLAPFHGPLALLWAQTLALALGAIPAHRLARHLTGDGVAALAVAALYLLHPAVGYVNLFEFHPEAFATAPLLAAIADLARGRDRRAIGWAALALLAREDVALVVLGLAAITAWTRGRGQRHTAGVLAACAVASLLFTFALLRPLFAHGEAEYARMFAAWGDTPGAAAAAMLSHPWDAIASLWSTPGDAGDSLLKREYWLHLLLPLLALPLADPRLLLAALPLIALHLLSSRPQQHAIVYQYGAAIVPFVVAAAAHGLARLGRLLGGRRPRGATRVLAALALVAALGSNAMFGPLAGRGTWQAHRAPQRWQPNEQDRRWRPYRERLVRQVPRDDAVVASFEFLPRLASRAELHSLHHLLSGTYTYSTRPYPVPARVDAMLGALGMEYRDRAAQERLLGIIARDTLRPVDAFDDVLLLRRAARDTLALLETVDSAAARPTHVLFDDAVELRGFDALPAQVAPGEAITIRTHWARRAAADHLYLTHYWLIDSTGGNLLYRTRYVGYGLFTADTWPLDTTMRETYRLVVPLGAAPGRYRVGLRVAHRKFGEPKADLALADRPELRDPGNLLQVGSIEVR